MWNKHSHFFRNARAVKKVSRYFFYVRRARIKHILPVWNFTVLSKKLSLSFLVTWRIWNRFEALPQIHDKKIIKIKKQHEWTWGSIKKCLNSVTVIEYNNNITTIDDVPGIQILNTILKNASSSKHNTSWLFYNPFERVGTRDKINKKHRGSVYMRPKWISR